MDAVLASMPRRTLPLSVVINPGDTTISNASISLTLNGEAVATDIVSADGILTVTASGLRAALASGVKYDLALTYTDSAVGEQTQTRKFEVPVYFEDFDSVELGPPVDELAVESEAAWTQTGPEGWTVDRSGVPGNSEDHVGYVPEGQDVADEDDDGYPGQRWCHGVGRVEFCRLQLVGAGGWRPVAFFVQPCQECCGGG